MGPDEQEKVYEQMRNQLNLEKSLDQHIPGSQRILNIQRVLIQKHREMFLSRLDNDQLVLHQMNKNYMVKQLKPFNKKLLETRIQMVEMYAWIQRLQKVLKKVHVAVFKGQKFKEDEYDMAGPYERRNHTIDQELVHELNVIGKKEYDQVRVFRSFEPDKGKQDPFGENIKSDRANDGESEDVVSDLVKPKREKRLEE